MTEIRVELLDQQAQQRISSLLKLVSDLRPLMQDLGEHLIETTKQRFQTSTGPDGKPWVPNSELTYLNYLGAFKGSTGKDGRLNAAGARRAANKKPLIGESRRLSSEIAYAADAGSVEISSSLIYSAAQHYGNPRNRYFGRALAPIPARPFMGVSTEDESYILDRAAAYLTPP